MSSVEEIPAFSTWKMFSDTISVVSKADCAESGVKRLANIIKSDEFSNIFVYNHDPSLSFQQYQKIADKYKSFTTWLLGRFFYFSSCQKLDKIQKDIFEAQLCILEQLSRTQLHVYDEISKEYSEALNVITDFLRNTNETKLLLKVFVPLQQPDLAGQLDLSAITIELTKRNCNTLLLQLVKFLKYISAENLLFHSFDSSFLQTMDNFLFLLSESPVEIKLEILEFYVEMLGKIRDGGGAVIGVKLHEFGSYFEQTIYEIYNEKIAVSETEFEQFQTILADYLQECGHLENTGSHLEELSGRLENAGSHRQKFSGHLENSDRLRNINNFLLKKSFSNGKTPRNSVLLASIKSLKGNLGEFSGDFPSFVKNALTSDNNAALYVLKSEILAEISNIENPPAEIEIFRTAGKWSRFVEIFESHLEQIECKICCKLKNFLETLDEISKNCAEICLQLKKNLIFFDDSHLFVAVLSKINQHFTSCSSTLNFDSILTCFSNFLILCGTKNVLVVFEILTYAFLKPQPFRAQFLGTPDHGQLRKEREALSNHLTRINADKTIALKHLHKAIAAISGELVEVNDRQIEEIEIVYSKIATSIIAAQDEDSTVSVIRNLQAAMTVFPDTNRLFSEILSPCLSSSNNTILNAIIKVIPTILCISSSNYRKVVKLSREESKILLDFQCEKCDGGSAGKVCQRVDADIAGVTGTILRALSRMLTIDECKVAALEALPFCSSHVIKFHSVGFAKMWAEKCGDDNKAVRVKFAEVVARIIKHEQENPVVSDENKTEILDILLSTVMKLTKKSLMESNFDLQETLLLTIEELCGIQSEKLVLPTIKILTYLLMVPTSKHSFIAINKLHKLAEKHNTTTGQLFKLHKQEMCETIVHLCAVNQALLDYSLAISLRKVSVSLEFYNSKDFVNRECHNLLPYFVAKVPNMPAIHKLIEEIALMVDSDLPELLASKYGKIFLHIFLNESRENFKFSSNYLEKTTKLSGPHLRKRSLRVILNELLLNFHEKRKKVLTALTLLSTEDADSGTVTVQEYLQPRFLGLLFHFDLKLMANNYDKKDLVLLSLADLFKFMGPKHLGPLRFKIIAMLRTADYNGYPELSCEVWNAFLQSCDVDTLGPQLATIFVSLHPLIEACPEKVNSIFKYLIVDHENETRDHIKDLFFVDGPEIDGAVGAVIKKHLKVHDALPLKGRIKSFLKYLTHETVEVKVWGFKHLKVLMEKNREELDRMILGYNGIDSVVVELIDILTLGCREKDDALKLACGEVIGELGAVEPSHLPRRYAQNCRNFTFFINDDVFVVNALTELTRALQGEKNTHSMDRFSLAIQEILKAHDISPSGSSAKNALWRQFPDSQQQIMLPLLSSRYIIRQPADSDFPSPIYGSAIGTSFQSWLYSWTCSLILTLPQDNQTIINQCLPAMKHDHKVLMTFLPYILLHSIIDDCQNAYREIKAVTASFDNKKKIDREIFNVRPFATPTCESLETTTPEGVKLTQCTKVVFVLLDFLDRWVREWQWDKGVGKRSHPIFVKIKDFLGKFCKLQLAKCNYQCVEYPRALMYLEDYVTENPQEMSKHLPFLAEIYAQLDEPDGVAGVTALQHSEPTIEQRILALEVSGKLSDAASCYERMTPPLQLHHLRGLVQCYLDLDNVNTALNFVQGAVDLYPQFNSMLFEMQAEPMWRLGRYDDLDGLLERPEMIGNDSWGIEIGKALLSFKNRDREQFGNILDRLKGQQVGYFGAASLEEGSYQHGYCYISRLHALNELQQVERATYEMLLKPNDGSFVENVVGHLAKEWELRVKVVQESVRIIEPLLCLRRVALEQAKRIAEDKVPGAVGPLNSLLGELWLLSAKTARSAGIHQQAYTYTLKAEEYAPKRLFLEKAKLHWLREEHEQALTTLRRGLAEKEARVALTLEEKKLCAEAKLLIAQYNDCISNVDNEMNVSNYKESIEMYKEWEKSLLSLAQYYDRLFQNYSDEDRDAKGSDMQIYMINYFGKSLQYGTTYVYQSMPRILSIWFDYGTRLQDVKNPVTREERRNNLVLMTKLIDSYLTRLPSYIFLTAFSQLVSRISHPQKEVYIQLKSIIVKLLLKYPQQTLWMIISVIKSGYAVRAKRCAEILADSQLKTATMAKLVKDFTSLAEKLIELCNKSVPDDVFTTTVSTLHRGLPRMLTQPGFSEIMIPTHKFRKLILPNPDFSTSQHNPFPNHYVHIAGIYEEVTILRSLQRPRKITLRGSDGKGYIQMLKPKDDLRKDFRLMEFNDIVNQLLSLEPEARQRRLNIRLYSVAPLNEECGLIEWVPNLVGLRPVLMTLYNQKGIGVKAKDLKEMSCNNRDPLAKKRDVFTKQLLPRHPPVLGEWFRRTFPDAQSWMIARTAYIRTTAVISMVGYILGLGDRHGENINLDSTCGDTVHVDFNCLFNKGETFEWPERVPFRLTHNMVAAMGPLGVEGVFRKSCACTLRVLRTNTTTLMSIVTPFVYDPLVSGQKNAPGTAGSSGEHTNEQAKDHVKNIELRLQGVVSGKSRSLSIPLSVEGQTNNLINSAISIDNLCQMYIGWGPHL